MIREITADELKDCHLVITESFSDIMTQLNITRENCSGFSGFLRYEKLLSQINKGLKLYGFYDPDLVGCIGVLKKSSTRYQVKYLCVKSDYRHQGIGRILIDYVENIAQGKIQLGMIYENTVLLNWYQSLGYEIDKITPYKSRVFNIAFMEKKIEKL